MNWNPYLLQNVYLGDYGYMNTFTLLIVLGSIVLTLITIAFLLRSGHRYTVHDTEAHATTYAGLIREGHGGPTVFILLIYLFMLAWTIYYFWVHVAEFNIWFAY